MQGGGSLMTGSFCMRLGNLPIVVLGAIMQKEELVYRHIRERDAS